MMRDLPRLSGLLILLGCQVWQLAREDGLPQLSWPLVVVFLAACFLKLRWPALASVDDAWRASFAVIAGYAIWLVVDLAASGGGASPGQLWLAASVPVLKEFWPVLALRVLLHSPVRRRPAWPAAKSPVRRPAALGER
jgi:hypothetical protein